MTYEEKFLADQNAQPRWIEVFYDGLLLSRVTDRIRPLTTQELIKRGRLDPAGNPPPPTIRGDMIPLWYDGRWWVCHADYIERKKANGDL